MTQRQQQALLQTLTAQAQQQGVYAMLLCLSDL
jgi:hypothetical protein